MLDSAIDLGSFDLFNPTEEHKMLREMVQRFVLGKDPSAITAIWQDIYDRSFWTRNGGAISYAALSAIEQALWDIKGKCLDAPVYELFGGCLWQDLEVYANGWWLECDTPDEYAEAAVSAGLTHFGQSCHSPWMLQEPGRPLAMGEEEIEDYVTDVLELRERFRGRVEILLGMEMDRGADDGQVGGAPLLVETLQIGVHLRASRAEFVDSIATFSVRINHCHELERLCFRSIQHRLNIVRAVARNANQENPRLLTD